jgi:hypothetical protein
VRRAIVQLERLLCEPQELIRRKLHEIVPEFKSLSDGVDPSIPMGSEERGLRAVV